MQGLLNLPRFLFKKGEIEGTMVLGLFPSAQGALQKPAFFLSTIVTFVRE
jgi:hypothetical protein